MTVWYLQLNVAMSKEVKEKLSDTNDGGVNTELKRPSPDSVLLQPSQATSSDLNHQSFSKKPKVTKRKKKRDPKEPQKPRTAYTQFYQENQASYKSENPTASFGDMSKIVAAAWETLDPDNKAAYKNRAEMARKDYLQDLEAYKAKVGKDL